MYYTIYKTTNNINGKYYIGKHQTTDLNDGYLGSGKLLKRAIKKYDIDNFSKEILHVFDTEEEMNLKEKELVVVSEETYNLCPGGHGGFGYINNNGLNNINHKASRAIVSQKLKGRTNSHLSEYNRKQHISGLVKYDTFTGKKHSETSKRKMSETKIRLGFQKGEKNSQYGKPRSEETKRKISETLKRKHQINVPI